MADDSAPSMIQEEPVDDLDDASEVIPFTYAITAYGADFPIDGLVKRIEEENIVVPRFNWDPGANSEIVGFQREYVWPRTKADKFIESLLLGFPVPGIFLVKEPSGRLLVLDGHQRLHTLHCFYTGIIEAVEYRLNNVQARFSDLRYRDLDIEDKRRLDDSIIHATIIRQDEPTEDSSSIYTIFERLNTGAMILQPQEIRVALYHGEFVKVLRELNENQAWRSLFGRRSKRLKDMELILRFFAFYFFSENYNSPMKDFLNRYMGRNQNLQRQSEDDLKSIFSSTVKLLADVIGPRAFRPKRAVNAAVVDSLLTGVARRIAVGPITDNDAIVAAYSNMINNPEYLDSIETGTSQEANVAQRMKIATDAFTAVP